MFFDVNWVAEIMVVSVTLNVEYESCWRLDDVHYDYRQPVEL
jgi:hypothetical protein